MKQELELKYNIPNVKLFLNIFGLELEEKSEYKKGGEQLLVFMNDVETGSVRFDVDHILIDAISIYGRVKAKSNYTEALLLTDEESFQTIHELGLYANWNNTFQFSVDPHNGTHFSGNICFAVKIDNEFGNMVSCHSSLDYQDGDKNYNIMIQDNGFPFRFIEKKKSYSEGICYNIFNTWGSGSYFDHIVRDKFMNGKESYDYDRTFFIGKANGSGKNNIAVSYTEFNDKKMQHSYQEFRRLSKDDEDSREVINRIEAMNLLDPSMRAKINQVIDEFSVGGRSFLETILLYGFTNYSYKEVDALFGLDKKGFDLEQAYFLDKNVKMIGSKIFNQHKW